MCYSQAMEESTVSRRPMRKQSALTRAFMRAPIWLYRVGLGGLLGQRFVHITHLGRVSGRARHVVLEVVSKETASGTYYVAAAWGERSDWYRNLMKTPRCTVQVGRATFDATAMRLDPDAAEEVLLDYARKHPTAMRALAKGMGFDVDGSEEQYRAVARQLPIVSLTPSN